MRVRGEQIIISFAAFASRLHFLDFSYLQKWTIFGIMIGVAAGASAVAFSLSTTFLTSLFLGEGAGFIPHSPGAGDAYHFLVDRPWAFPLITGVGGLAVGLLVSRLSPEAEGHGTDSVIDAFHNREGDIRSRVPLVKGIASAITLGSGGSGGSEGPLSQVAAGLSSTLARLLKFGPEDRRIAVAAGLAAGIGSIFKVPLGAALFGTEVFYRRDFEVKALVPAVIASVVGYTFFGFVFGWSPIFSVSQDTATYSRPVSLVLYAIIGVVCAAVSIAYVRVFYLANRVFAGMKKVPRYARPAIGGAAVGVIAMFAPQVHGTSYGWLQLVMLSSPLLLPLWVLLAVIFLKIIATSLTIGSGGSAGVFGPSMVIGGLLGAFVGGLFHSLGLFMWIDVSSAAIVGMVAFFSATAKTPISTIVMGSELTGGYGLLAPMMIATVVAYAASGINNSIFKSQVPSRRESPAHSGDYDVSVLRALKTGDAVSQHFIQMPASTPVAKAVQEAEKSRALYVFIGDPATTLHEKSVLQVISISDMLGQNDATTLASLRGRSNSSTGVPVVDESESLYGVFNLLASAGSEIIAVTAGGRLAGTLSFRDIARVYHCRVHSKFATDL